MRRTILALALALMLPTTAHAQSADVVNVISHVAYVYGLPVDRMMCIARLESTFQPGVVSYAGHRGLYQFERLTWQEQAPRFGISPDFMGAYDLATSATLAAALMAEGQWWRWSVARYC